MVAVDGTDGQGVLVESSDDEEELIPESDGLSAQLDTLSSTSSMRLQRLEHQAMQLRRDAEEVEARRRLEENLKKLEEEAALNRRRVAAAEEEASLSRQRIAAAKAEADELDLQSRARKLKEALEQEDEVRSRSSRGRPRPSPATLQVRPGMAPQQVSVPPQQVEVQQLQQNPPPQPPTQTPPSPSHSAMANDNVNRLLNSLKIV